MDTLNFVKKTIEKHNMLLGNHVLVALSGGCDSVSLLHILIELGYYVSAVHINHNLRGKESDDDERFCSELCELLGVDLHVYNYQVEEYAKKHGKTIEESGRELRYKAFSETKEKIGADKIATGHNRDDSVETFLLNLIRGTGIAGLSGIPAVRGDIVRPIIDCTRFDLELFCSKNNIVYKTDMTNFDTIYTRNQIRKKVLPSLEKINYAVKNNLKKTLDSLSVDSDYIDKMAKQALKECLINDIIEKEKFLELDKALQPRVIMLVCKNMQNIGSVHINSIIELFHKQTGKIISLPNNLIAKKVYKGVQIKSKKTIEKIQNFCYNIKLGDFVHVKEQNLYISLSEQKDQNLQQNFQNIYTQKFFCDKIKNGMTARTRQQGDKVYISGVGTQTLKKFFVNNKIEKRDTILFAVDNNVLYIPGVYEEETDSSEQLCYLQIWRKNDNTAN